MPQKEYFNIKASDYLENSSKGIWGICKKSELKFFLKIISKYIHDNNTYNALDIGCGPGIYSIFCRKHLPQLNIYGIDSSKKMIKELKNNGFQGECIDLNKYQKRKRKISFIFIFGVFEFQKSISQTLKAIKRNTNKNTLIFLLVPRLNIYSIGYFLYHSLKKNIYIHKYSNFQKQLLENEFEIIESHKVWPINKLYVCKV